jgi:hypothetical protein
LDAVKESKDGLSKEKAEMKSVFLMNVDTLEEFFKRCLAANATTEEQKTVILIELLKEQKATYIGNTDKSAPELATELIKKGVRARSYTKKAAK